MKGALVAAVVTLGAVQVLAWGRLGVVDRENARLRTSLESAERRAADFPVARRVAARPAVATQIPRPVVEEADAGAAPDEPARQVGGSAIQVQTEAQVMEPDLEDRLGLDAGQRAWLETLRQQWVSIAGPYWLQSRRMTPDELEFLKSTARRFDEAFRAMLTPEQLVKLKGIGWPPLLWSIDGC